MKVHPITDDHLQIIGIDPMQRHQLCMYQAEKNDTWRGFVVGRRGWDGLGIPHENPASTFHSALTNWFKLLMRACGK
jgi:hypothetical protein